MLYGMYAPEETGIGLDDADETQVEAVDVLVALSRLRYRSVSGDERDASFFREMRDWFQSTWDVLGSESPRGR